MEGLTRKVLKVIVVPVVELFMKIAPQFLLEQVIAAKPSLIDYLSKTRKFLYKKYLGDISVHIDTVYPIERQMFTGFYEKDTLNLIDKIVKEGDVCFDIGANVGPVSFALAKKTGVNGEVFAFEPGSEIFQRLENNIKENPRYKERIKAYKIGFSDKEETLFWNEDKSRPIINRLNCP